MAVSGRRIAAREIVFWGVMGNTELLIALVGFIIFASWLRMGR
jgi:hypothetical protein